MISFISGTCTRANKNIVVVIKIYYDMKDKVFLNSLWDDGIGVFIVGPEVFDAVKPSK